ncbi:MAG: hypothetical protein K6G57_08205 [Lachnospiraceae bacterium]|nr:hypothetical protein [Lachnospiraceae bacterium]
MADTFGKALGNFTFDVAARGGIRHLYDLGLSPEEISQQLDYPVSIARIEEEIESYKKEKESGESDYEYVRETSAFGSTSFIRVKKKNV